MSNRAYYSTQSGFRKGYPCQTALITLINKWVTEIEYKNIAGTFILNL